jgi:hypothetical protein
MDLRFIPRTHQEYYAMKFVQACLVTGLVFGIPAVTSAQQIKASPSDIVYCNALGKAYSSMFPAMEAMPASDAVTMNRCDTHTRVSIVTLEDKLKNKKIELPPHVGVASSH